MKNINRLFCCLLVSLLATSCSSNVTVTKDDSKDFYNYNIGEGETVFVFDNSFAENEKYCDFLDAYDWSKSVTIYSLKLEDGTVLDTDIISVSNNSYDQVSLTCLKPFDDEIKIDRIIYDFDGTLVDVKYNIDLTFNSNYITNPSFPAQYADADQLVMYDMGKALLHSSTTFYLMFSKHILEYDESDSFIVNSLESSNNLFSLSDIKYGAIPVNFVYEYFYWDEETVDFVDFEKIDLNDFEYGFILEFTISYDEENIISLGGDVDFNIEVNGDTHDVFYHIYYDIPRDYCE